MGNVSWFLEAIGNPPELDGARCNSDIGRKLVDKILERGGEEAEMQLAMISDSCPVREKCLKWVTVGEGRKPGLWGLPYGGMTAQERRQKGFR